MTTLVTAANIADLRRMVAELDTANYSDADLTTMIEKYPMLDEAGEDPYSLSGTAIPVRVTNPKWIPTYNLNLAACEVWEHKAALLAGKFDFSADGGQFSRSQAYNQALQMAKYYRGRGGISTITQIKKPDESASVYSWIGNLPEED